MAPGGREQVRLQCRLKALSDRSGNCSVAGRRFNVAGPLTAKLRCPVAVRARGTNRVPVATFRRCWRPEMAVAGTMWSEPWTDFQTIKPSMTSWKLLADSQVANVDLQRCYVHAVWICGSYTHDTTLYVLCFNSLCFFCTLFLKNTWVSTLTMVQTMSQPLCREPASTYVRGT